MKWFFLLMGFWSSAGFLTIADKSKAEIGFVVAGTIFSWVSGFLFLGEVVQADRRFFHCPDCGSEEIEK